MKRSRYSRLNTRVTYLALKDEAVIGEAQLEDDGEIAIVVSKDFRDEGIGVSLVKQLIEEAKLKGMKRMKFFCMPSNIRMTWLGDFLGFRLLKHLGMEDEWVLDL